MQNLCGNILLIAFLDQYRTNSVHDNYSVLLNNWGETYFNFNIFTTTALTEMKPKAALSASANDIVKTDTVDSLSSFWQKLTLLPTFFQTPRHNACWLNLQNHNQTC